ncbi:MAG: NYN domain-containing protein [Alistipes onderdonkii]
MDILHKESVNGFCIVSSDSDYTRLASRIRESGREVLGFGEKDPKPFIKSCANSSMSRYSGSPHRPGSVSAPAQTAAAVPAAKAATPKKTAKKHQGRNAPEQTCRRQPRRTRRCGEKVAPAPDTAQPQPIIRPIDDDFKTLLANTIEDAADDSGWAFLGIVGGVLTKKMPDFDPRNYGYKKLSLLVKSLSKIVEIEERPSENKELKLVYVRNRIR